MKAESHSPSEEMDEPACHGPVRSGSSSKTAPGDWRRNKRTRKAYSCIPCHKRKVKCDRQRPCGGCIKRAEPSACIWETEESNADLPSEERDKLLARIRTLETTLVQIRKGDSPPAASHDHSRHPTPAPHAIPSSVYPMSPGTFCTSDYGPPEPHPLAMYTQGGLLEEPKAFPFSSLYDGEGAPSVLDVLPRVESAYRILGIFWNHYDAVHPIFSRHEFKSIVDDFYNLPEASRSTYPPSRLAMLYAGLALGALFSGGDERVKQMPYEVLPGESVVQARQRAARATAGVYASAAWHLVKLAAFLSTPSEYTVSTTLWLELYLMHEDRPRDAWVMHGMSFRCVLILLSAPGGDIPARDRLWRYVVYAEAYLSLQFGQPGIPLGYLYPAHLVRSGTPRHLTHLRSDDYEDRFELELARLTVLMERVVAHRSATLPVLSSTQFRTLAADLRSWRLALPPELDSDAPGFNFLTVPPRRAHMCMKLALEHRETTVFLHRTYKTRWDPERDKEEYEREKKEYTTALHDLVRRYHEAFKFYPETFIANVWAGYCILFAALECCSYATSDADFNSRNQAIEDIRHSLDIFYKIRGTNPVAAKGLVMLENQLANLERNRGMTSIGG